MQVGLPSEPPPPHRLKLALSTMRWFCEERWWAAAAPAPPSLMWNKYGVLDGQRRSFWSRTVGVGGGAKAGGGASVSVRFLSGDFLLHVFRVRLVVAAASLRTALTGANGRYSGRSYGAQLSPRRCQRVLRRRRRWRRRWMEAWMDGQSEERKRWKRKRIVLHKEAVYCPAWNGEHKRRCSSRRRRWAAAPSHRTFRRKREAFARSANFLNIDATNNLQNIQR